MNVSVTPERASLFPRILVAVLFIGLFAGVNLFVWYNGQRGVACPVSVTFAASWGAWFRWPGAWLGSKLGTVARHGVGWFFSFAGGVAGLSLYSFVLQPDRFARDMRDGVAAAVYILSFVGACVTEIIASGVDAFMKSSARHLPPSP